MVENSKTFVEWYNINKWDHYGKKNIQKAKVRSIFQTDMYHSYLSILCNIDFIG